jgi:hypothetical protein
MRKSEKIRREENVMKNWKKIAAVLLSMVFVLCLLPGDIAQAGTKVADSTNGKYTYYSVYASIYRLDSETGKDELVKEVYSSYAVDHYGAYVSGLTYYDGYLYFAKCSSNDGGDEYICRMKEDGTGLSTFESGYHPVIYNDKIYYIAEEYDREEDWSYSLGISCMDLDGKNAKRLIDDFSIYNFYIVNGKIYYAKDSKFYQYSIKSGKTKKKCSTKSTISGLLGVDGDNIVFESSEKVCVYDTKNNKTYETTIGNSFSGDRFAGVKNNKIYYYSAKKGALRTYNMNTKKSKTLKTKNKVTGITFSQSGYNVCYVDTGFVGNTNYAAARIKKDGTGYKVLRKYFVQ